MQEDEFLVWFFGSLISCWSPNLKVMPSICGPLYDILSLLPQRFDIFQSHLETGLVEDIKQWSYMNYLNQDKFQISIEHRNYGWNIRRKGDKYVKLCAEMLLRFQRYLESLSPKLGLGLGFFSISLLRVIRIKQSQIWRRYVANIKVYKPQYSFILKAYMVGHLELITS